MMMMMIITMTDPPPYPGIGTEGSQSQVGGWVGGGGESSESHYLIRVSRLVEGWSDIGGGGGVAEMGKEWEVEE